MENNALITVNERVKPTKKYKLKYSSQRDVIQNNRNDVKRGRHTIAAITVLRQFREVLKSANSYKIGYSDDFFKT